ncbi:MAG: DinB family protein [Gemmatimonadetes bacterium]|nr:DinB family protein [Gemmatimonadota bacterium]
MATTQQSHKSRFLDAYQREHATTQRVLDALPKHQSNFKPHDRSSSAATLAWTFVVEQLPIVKALRGEPFGGGFPKAPDSFDAILAEFKKGHDDVVEALHHSTNESLEGTVKFFTGPKQMGDIPLESFVWFMLHDQIHHRGQLSVYVRMAGGQVPSIYGPSADEPW